MEIYDFTVKNRKGEEISLKNYKGKVLLIVNTATRCGFTPQYNDLEKLFEKYNKDGLEILDFPCNQFGNQAPETNEEIHNFCQLNYEVKFDQFSKIEVNGKNALPLFNYLKEQKGFTGFDPTHKLTTVLTEMLTKNDPDFAKKSDIKWNFTKFLIDKSGNVVARFEPTTSLEKIEEEIKKLLKK
ncbi:glutathione peroxidase [Fusobacterium simiae]|nr:MULTISPECIES: glutathione peroxidase [Fusobacterium]MDC7954584.1 glutathione peroxidase [Fusobacterium simiae]